MTKQVLFLCTGNYYRSRYAEELFNHLSAGADLGWRAFSRGAAEQGSPENVGPMSRFARDALDADGITPEGALREPQPATSADFEKADLIIGLKDVEHRPLMERRFPTIADRVIYWHIDDIDFAHPSVALPMIATHIKELIAELSQRTT
jgi:protein-tyrosine phosphatase